MRRREFILAAGALALHLPALAQRPAPPHRIGFLGNSTAGLEANLIGPFRDGLRDLGYVEGQNIAIDFRWAEGRYERFPSLIAELIALKPAVIVSAGTPAAVALKQATTTIALVTVAVGDPVGTGLVASLARPGGNITGLTSIAAELEGKRLELLREVNPQLARVAILWNPTSAFQAVAIKQAQAAAGLLRLNLHTVEVRSADDFDAAFAAIVRERAAALVVLADRLFLHNRARIVEFAARQRLPAVYAYRELVEAGGLMSLGPNYADMHRRAAAYVDKILKGSRAGDLPIEQPTKFELVINMAAAKAQGIAIPQPVLARSDHVIQPITDNELRRAGTPR